jgi:toxin CptA
MKIATRWPRAELRTAFAAPGFWHNRWPMLAVLALAVPLLWLSLLVAPPLQIDVGEWGDQAALSGANQPERSASESYRWTTERAELRLPNLSGRYRLLRLRVHGWRPAGMAAPRLQVLAEGRLIATFQTSAQLQTYDVLLPADDWRPERAITLLSDAFVSAEDGRHIGVALDTVELRQVGGASLPAAGQFLGQMLLLALALLLIGLCGLPRGAAAALSVGVLVLLLAANAQEPLWVGQALWGWGGALLVLVAATLLARPPLLRWLVPWLGGRRARLGWALFVGALALRLLGAVHPQFDMHDLPFHTKWLSDVAGGQIYIYSTPSEFQNRPVINLSGGYILLMPLQLLALTPRLAVQTGVVLADALGGLLLLGLARAIGLGGRAALLAAVLYWMLPITMTMLWWGFATNALAQPAGIGLAWLLLRLEQRPTGRRCAVFAVACACCMLLHLGALALLLVLLGAALALGWRAAAGRWAVLGAGALALAAVGVLYFAAAWVPPSGRAGGLAGVLARGWEQRAGRFALVGLGAVRGFLPVTLALAGPALLLVLGARTPPLGRALLGGWVAAIALFLGVYLGFGLVVRFVYFAVPPVCVALGVLLNDMWVRRGRAVVLGLLLLIVWGGVALWFAGVLMRLKPSALPLTY